MKIRLCWQEKFEVAREYPGFILDTQKFPELELEIQNIYEAQDQEARNNALDDLEYKMNHTEQRGETIMEIVGPWNEYDKSSVFPISDGEGTLKVLGGEGEG